MNEQITMLDLTHFDPETKKRIAERLKDYDPNSIEYLHAVAIIVGERLRELEQR